MRTGVSPKRIATGKIVCAILQSVRAAFPLFADTSYLAHRVKPSYRTVCSFLSVQASLSIQSLDLRLLPFCFRQNSLTGVCFYMNKFPTCFFLWSGAHLLSHIVSNAVPSAAQVLTVVFGMGTGVSPKRIDTGNIGYRLSYFFISKPLDNSTVKHIIDFLLLP